MDTSASDEKRFPPGVSATRRRNRSTVTEDVTTLTDRSGIAMHFVENELVVANADADAGAVAALAARWGGRW